LAKPDGAHEPARELQAAVGHVQVASGSAEHRVREVGFRPSAALVWWSAQAAVGRAEGCTGGVGFAAASDGRAVAWRAVNGVETTVAQSAAASAAVVLPDTTAARCGRFGALDDGFTLTWDRPPAQPLLLHYLALGGGVTAAVGSVVSRAQTTSRARLPFLPDVVFVAAAADGDGLLANFGAAVIGGRQACTTFLYPAQAPPEAVVGAQLDGCVVAVPADDRSGFASVVRVIGAPDDADLGLSCDGVADVELHYLALSGLRGRLDLSSSPARPARMRRRVGFRPTAVLAYSWGLAASAQPKDIGRISLGAATSPGATGSTAWFARDVPGPVTKTGTVASSEELLLVPDTQRHAMHASMKLATVDRRGFGVSWAGTDSYPRQFVSIALGAVSSQRRRGLAGVVRSATSRLSASARRRRAVRIR
jgi:hypothetical protein